MKHGLAAESPSRMPPPPTKRTNRMQSPNWAAAGNVAMGVATPERPWTVEERQAIRNAVIEHGEQEWAKVVAAMQPYGRTADECRRHWTLTYPLVKVRRAPLLRASAALCQVAPHRCVPVLCAVAWLT